MIFEIYENEDCSPKISTYAPGLENVSRLLLKSFILKLLVAGVQYSYNFVHSSLPFVEKTNPGIPLPITLRVLSIATGCDF